MNKKDIRNLIILITSFLIFVIIIANVKYYYGSSVDWFGQHIAFPEYFRDLFYKTKDLFPDFAFNIGSGQNIYNFSYYGLLSPIILLSYLFPFINMTTYIMVSSILIVMISGVLMYKWLQSKGYNRYICFICSFIMMFALPLSFHSHRHIMFMSYMPFLIMGLFGVDKKLDNNKSWLLALSVFLMIMTSYYFSICGIFCLVIYGIYKYLNKNKKIKFIKFIKDGISFVAPMIIGVLISGIIIIPTFYVILNGRGETYNTITLLSLIKPSINLDYYIYNSYGIGLTAIIFVAILSLLDKKKENMFISILFLLFLIIPIFSYILNATMYVDAKAFIPLLPMCIYVIALFLDKVFKKEINYKKLLILIAILSICAISNSLKYYGYLLDLLVLFITLFLYHKFDKKMILVISICIVSFISAIIGSKCDSLVNKKEENTTNSIKEAINYITENDDTFYRISTQIASNDSMNKIYNNLDYYNSTLYSSIYNKNYNKFYYDVINNNIQSRNRVITSSTRNSLSLVLTNNKYYLSTSSSPLKGYEQINKIDNIYIYNNEDVLPIGYASSNIMNINEFNKLEFPYNTEAILNNIITSDNTNTNYVTNIKKISYKTKDIEVKNLDITEDDGTYEIVSNGKGTMIYDLAKEYQDKTIYIKFKLNESQSCDIGDLYITINGNKNKLTCASWKYHNQNYEFDYVLNDETIDKLYIKFNKGTFKISDIELYAMDYAYVDSISSNIDELIIDKEKTKGDYIEGNINVTNDSYFNISISYDNGFTILLDDEKIEYENVNDGFIGFPINQGEHNIKIKYTSPGKSIGSIISIIGLISFIIVVVIESKRKI